MASAAAFAAGRPPFEDVDVLITESVGAWELYKLRIVNPTHTCMTYLSSLAGIVFVDQGDGDAADASLSRAPTSR